MKFLKLMSISFLRRPTTKSIYLSIFDSKSSPYHLFAYNINGLLDSINPFTLNGTFSEMYTTLWVEWFIDKLFRTWSMTRIRKTPTQRQNYIQIKNDLLNSKCKTYKKRIKKIFASVLGLWLGSSLNFLFINHLSEYCTESNKQSTNTQNIQRMRENNTGNQNWDTHSHSHDETKGYGSKFCNRSKYENLSESWANCWSGRVKSELRLSPCKM